MFKQLRLAVGPAVTATLVACGGWASGSALAAPVASTETFPLKTVVLSFANDNRSLSFSISGTTQNKALTGNGMVYQGSLTPTTFEGRQALGKKISFKGSGSIGGTTVPLDQVQTEYYDTNYIQIGLSGPEYEVVVGTANIPESGKVGAAGILYTSNRYPSIAKNTLVGIKESSFTLEPDTASTAILRLTETRKNNVGTKTDSTNILFRITTTGRFTRLSETSVNDTDNVRTVYSQQ